MGPIQHVLSGVSEIGWVEAMSLSLPENGELITLDKDIERSKVASNFFKKAKQESKIKTFIAPALESLSN